ncbi:MAG: FlgD immunoglobulin-like domain containing protein [candidate division WOR-3 bacterium]
MTVAHAQFQREWQSGNLGTYAWGASYGYDVDNDNVPNMWTRDSGRIIIYRNFTPWWTVDFGRYAYPFVVTPRDIDGDGLVRPVNMDGDPSGEVVMTAYRISGQSWSGIVRVYDASSRQLEWESAELAGFTGTASVDDVDGDGKHEIVLTRYDYSGGWGYVEVYGHVGAGLDSRPEYAIKRSEPVALPSVSTGPTKVRFELAEPTRVRLVIYDRAGQAVCTLVDAALPAGEYDISWNGRSDNQTLVPAGTYCYRLWRGNEELTGWLIIVR